MKPKEFVKALNEEGCGITLELYQSFCEALCVHEEHREEGEHEYRKPRAGGADAVFRTPATIESDYDEQEKATRRKLRDAHSQHLNRTFAGNRFIEA
jgi:hypothetical protein